MIEAIPYSGEHRNAWDDLIRGSRNGTFLFLRNYMDYHSDRFEDASLLFLHKGRLIGVLPASRHDDVVVSHGGLTYGGVISTAQMTTSRMLETFAAMADHYRQRGTKALRYKVMPTIYHNYPAQEDVYALFRAGARQYRVDVSSTVDLNSQISFSKGRKHAIAKGRKAGLVVRCCDDYPAFWGILEEVLSERHGARPTHTLDEIQLLASRFPDQIALYGAFEGQRMLAGAVIYDCGHVVHCQYLGTGVEGRDVGALDLVLHHLIREVYAQRCYFDFGISTEEQGRHLNEGLIAQKEMFGGRAIAHPFYEIDLCKEIDIH